MPVISWLYGTPISGISFPMVTASGPFATGYAAASLSAVISKDGGAWAAIGSRISGIPGDGVYTLASLSSTEMQCYTWTIKITANSGSLEQAVMGINQSGRVLYSDISGFAHSVDCSGNNGMLTAISGLKNDVSGLPGILTAVSGLNTSNLIAQCSSIIGATSTVMQANVISWNGNSSISSVGGSILANVNRWVGGLVPQPSSVGVPNVNINTISNNTPTGGLSGLVGVGINVSSVGAIRDMSIQDADSLTSGTLGHTARLIRWFTWENTTIEKTVTPYQQYFFDGTNYSSYFQINDNANRTTRIRGG